MSPTTVYKIEPDRTMPSFRTIRKLGSEFDVDSLDVAQFAAVIKGTGAGKAVV
jgi:hypothetical protein